MTTFYLTRHGETQWNTLRRMQGHLNSDLTKLGEMQASALGKSLIEKHIQCIYSSSSGRTLQTSTLVNQFLNVEIIPRDELMEIHLGNWEGKTKLEIEAFDAEQYHYFWEAPELFKPNSGEHFYEVSKRALKALEQIAQFHQGDTLLIVTHAVVLKSLLMAFNQIPLKEFWSGAHMTPTCLNKVIYDQGQWHVEFVGDTAHYHLIEGL